MLESPRDASHGDRRTTRIQATRAVPPQGPAACGPAQDAKDGRARLVTDKVNRSSRRAFLAWLEDVDGPARPV